MCAGQRALNTQQSLAYLYNKKRQTRTPQTHGSLVVTVHVRLSRTTVIDPTTVQTLRVLSIRVAAASMRVTMVLFVATACVGPRVSDDFGYSPRILPPGTAVEAIDDDVRLASQVRENDGLEEIRPIPRQEGFADRRRVYYWDFGESSRFAVPFYSFNHCDEEGNPLRGDDAPPRPMHPSIAYTAPGDGDYSPFWRVFNVCVADRWQGEQFTTLEALDDGVTIGLVAEPVPTTFWFNCPFVLADSELEVGGGVEPIPPNGQSYYFGRTIAFYSFASGFLTEDAEGNVSTSIAANAVYLLRRASEEAAAQVVFQHAKTIPDGMGGMMPNPEYVDLVSLWDVVVSDTADLSSLTSEAAMFTRDTMGDLVPLDDTIVLSASDTRVRVNWPQQTAEGMRR